MRGRSSLLLFASVLLAACGPSSTPIKDMNSTEVTLPNGSKILCETMVRDMDLTRGMMFQDTLPKDRGMILIHRGEVTRPAFTYNVRIPLDIVWLDKNQRIVEITANIPPCPSRSARECPLYGGKQKSRYVLELNAGAVATNGLKIGDQLTF